MPSTSWELNNTGATIPAGSVVESDPATTRGIRLSVAGSASASGIAKRDIPHGQWGEIVTSGVVQVLVTAAVTNGWWLQASDSVAGQADGAAIPPGLVLQHFDEIGHARETVVGPGLCWATVHFN